MKMTTLKITKDIIDTAIRRDGGHCMIADAIRAKHPDATYIHVDLQSVRFSDFKKGERYIYFTPPNAQLALLNFDQGKEVEPFTCACASGVTRKVSRIHRGGKRYKKPTTKHPHPRRYREYGLGMFIK